MANSRTDGNVKISTCFGFLDLLNFWHTVQFHLVKTCFLQESNADH